MEKPTLRKRNTCGTIYVENTMTAPDKDATIKCVCGVYRAHLVQAAREESHQETPRITFEEYEIFNDIQSVEEQNLSNIGNSATASTAANIVELDSAIELSFSSSEDSHETAAVDLIPSLEEITSFYRYAFHKAQMESDCIIMSLIYVERLLRETNGGVRPNLRNWRSVLFSCMVMASKVWDDLSMWNKDFSKLFPKGVKFTLKRINELERALLTCLKYNVKVKASEYAKYYFLMRSMLIRSGLAGEELHKASPLDIEGARKLEVVSANYSTLPVISKLKTITKKSKSLGEVEDNASPKAGGVLKDGRSNQVKLEHIVKM